MTTRSTRATQTLEEAGIDHRLHVYEMPDHDDSRTYGEAVAAAVGVQADRLFKTLVFDIDGEACIAIVPADSRVSTKKLARAAGGKRAEMVDPATAERLTGYVIGGISPFGQRRTPPFYVDEMILVQRSILVSGGRRGLQIEIAPDDLVRLTLATIADLTE